MMLRRWNYETHQYDPFEVPDDRKALMYAVNMNEPCQCASCGKNMIVGDSYTSLEIQGIFGFGYMVCEECYEQEWKRRLKYEEEKK